MKDENTIGSICFSLFLLTETEGFITYNHSQLKGGFILLDKMDACAKIEYKNEEHREKCYFNCLNKD